MSEVERDLSDLFDHVRKPGSVQTHPTFLLVMLESHLEHGHAQENPLLGKIHTFLKGLQWKGAEEREIIGLIERHCPELRNSGAPGFATRATALTPKI